MTARHRRLLAGALLALVLVAALVLQLTGGGPGRPGPAAPKTQAAVTKAGLIAQATPVTTNCDVPVGRGVLGACAPKQAYAHVPVKASSLLGAKVTAKASSVKTIRGLLGVDVSSNNGAISFAAYRGAFAWVKASESSSYTNPYFAGQWATLRSRHIPHGAYDFTRPGLASAAQEAHHFCAVVNAHGGFDSLPPAVDVEWSALSPAATRTWVAQNVAAVRKCSHRPDVVTYTGAWFWNPHVGGSNHGTALWISGYANAPLLPGSWKSYRFWQFTDGVYGPVPHALAGVGRNTDVSVFNGSAAQLAALAGGASSSTTGRGKIKFTAAERHTLRLVIAERHRSLKGNSPTAKARRSVIRHGKLTIRRYRAELRAAARKTGWKIRDRARRYAGLLKVYKGGTVTL